LLKKVGYTTEAERMEIIQANKSLYLIEEQNITEGNFLIFSDVDETTPTKIVYVQVREKEINDLKAQQAAMSADFQAFMDMYFEQNPM
jgi:thiamine monophosphate synthase